MADINVFASVSISPLINGDNLHTSLNSTLPLYQTFKKGTEDFSPNWATSNDADRPVIFPQVFSTMEGRSLSVKDVSFKYNSVLMTFDDTGLCTAPAIPQGKVKLVDYNGSKALKIIGNIASEDNNDSDTISFVGKVQASGQDIQVSADTTLLVEESINNLYRLFLVSKDDIIDGDEEYVTATAILYNNGVKVETGVEYEFSDVDGSVLQARGLSNTIQLTKAMIGGQLVLVAKAFQGDLLVAQEHRLMYDSTDQHKIVCDKGRNVKQDIRKDEKYTFMLQNRRTGK